MLSFLQGDPKKKLRKVLGKADLPSFPRAVAHALGVLRNPAARPAEIAQALAADPGVSVRVLRTVNSAAYAPRRRVEALDQAVVLLGRANVEQVVLSVAVRASLPAPRCDGFDARRFWATAAWRAAVARGLAEVLHPATGGECFTAGMLQDLAVPLLAERRGAEYGEVLRQWHAGTEPLVALERQALGHDHTEVGGWVCEDWQLPGSLSQAAAGHHDIEGDSCPPAVRLAGFLREVNEESGVERLVEEGYDRFGLQKDSAVCILEEAREKGEQLARLLA